jgi:hypothetical protein
MTRNIRGGKKVLAGIKEIGSSQKLLKSADLNNDIDK